MMCFRFLALALLTSTMLRASLPSAFDLRNVGGKTYVTSIKSQSGGTCWTFGTVSAVESNLYRNGAWAESGQSGEPALAEYHLDWWNGFNQHQNADIAPRKGGLTVHQGGDYKVATAYLARGGLVRDKDGQSFDSPPKENDPSYIRYYVRDIEWYSAGKNLENIESIKQAIYENGVIGTAIAWSDSFYSGSKRSFYQPPSSSAAPNHAVSILGWDDSKVTQAPRPGAWLAKNSWGASWGEGGYFWISYYDKVSTQHPEMGAVSFRNTERMRYSKVYSHDYHGWRDQKAVDEVLNVFEGSANRFGREVVSAVSFFTLADNVTYRVTVYGKFNGSPEEPLSEVEGVVPRKGFHTVDLHWPVVVHAGQKFAVGVALSEGGHAFDRTSDVPLLLGASSRTLVESKAEAGQSYFLSNGTWVDLTQSERTGNFSIKALSTVTARFEDLFSTWVAPR